MSKALEAFEYISHFTCFGNEYWNRHYDDKLNAIEKGLKALEIIKEKGINLYKLKMCDNVEEYNKLCNTSLPLTQEEYDLLKEVLL